MVERACVRQSGDFVATGLARRRCELEPRAECGAQRAGGGAHERQLLGPPALALSRAQVERADALRAAQQRHADAVAQVAGTRRSHSPRAHHGSMRAVGRERVQRDAVAVECRAAARRARARAPPVRRRQTAAPRTPPTASARRGATIARRGVSAAPSARRALRSRRTVRVRGSPRRHAACEPVPGPSSDRFEVAEPGSRFLDSAGLTKHDLEFFPDAGRVPGWVHEQQLRVAAHAHQGVVDLVMHAEQLRTGVLPSAACSSPPAAPASAAAAAAVAASPARSRARRPFAAGARVAVPTAAPAAAAVHAGRRSRQAASSPCSRAFCSAAAGATSHACAPARHATRRCRACARSPSASGARSSRARPPAAPAPAAGRACRSSTWRRLLVLEARLEIDGVGIGR